MHPVQAALDARVSSAQQAEAHPVASQVAAWCARSTAAGMAVPAALQGMDDGERGATLVRPAWITIPVPGLVAPEVLAAVHEPWRAHPGRLAVAYRRRGHPDSPTKHTPRTPREAPRGQLRQGWARVIDRSAEALIEKHALEPRITRLRQRIAHGEAQRQPLAAQEVLDTDLRLIIGRLDDFAAPRRAGSGGWEPDTGAEPGLGQAGGGGTRPRQCQLPSGAPSR